MRRRLKIVFLIIALRGITTLTTHNHGCSRITDCEKCVFEHECIFVQTKSDHQCIPEEDLLLVGARRTFKNEKQCQTYTENMLLKTKSASKEVKKELIITPDFPTVASNFDSTPHSFTSELIVPNGEKPFHTLEKDLLTTKLTKGPNEELDNGDDPEKTDLPRVLESYAPPPYSTTSVSINPIHNKTFSNTPSLTTNSANNSVQASSPHPPLLPPPSSRPSSLLDTPASKQSWDFFDLVIPLKPFVCPGEGGYEKMKMKVELALCRLAVVSKRFKSHNQKWNHWQEQNVAHVQFEKCEYLKFIRQCQRTFRIRGKEG